MGYYIILWARSTSRNFRNLLSSNLHTVLINAHALQVVTRHLVLALVGTDSLRIFFHVGLGFVNDIVARHTQCIGVTQVLRTEGTPSFAESAAFQQTALGWMGTSLLGQHATVLMHVAVHRAGIAVREGITDGHEIFSRSCDEEGSEQERYDRVLHGVVCGRRERRLMRSVLASRNERIEERMTARLHHNKDLCLGC